MGVTMRRHLVVEDIKEYPIGRVIILKESEFLLLSALAALGIILLLTRKED